MYQLYQQLKEKKQNEKYEVHKPPKLRHSSAGLQQFLV